MSRRCHRSRVLVAWCLGGVLAARVTAAAAAAPCPVDPSIEASAPSLATIDGASRLAFIQAAMEDGARRSRAWALGWGLTYGAAAVTQLAVLPVVDADTRIDLYFGAGSALIGVLTRSIMIPRVLRERRRLRRLGVDTWSECRSLHEHERALARSAKSERFGRSLALHAAALVYNAGIGLTLGLGLHRPVSGNRQAAIGGAVGQLMIVTQPTTMVAALDRYRRGSPRRPHGRVPMRPWVVYGGGGVVLGWRL